MPVITKICGLSSAESIDVAVKYGAAYLGFVFFAPSPRNISPERAALLTAHMPEDVHTVAVTVSMEDAAFDRMLAVFKPDYLQLHGGESPARVREVRLRYGIPVIKAIAVSDAADIARAAAYEECADMLLFDAKAPKDALLPGGNGVAFEWELLERARFSLPWFLSGGLSCGNVREAVEKSGATRVDISSGIESNPGVKDNGLIKEFLTITGTL
jgi:phosphoribosylanthranilate isomerase